MGFFDSAKDSLKGAVGDMAEGSVDSVREAVAEVLQEQLEDLLGKAVVKMIGAVNEELQTFAALHLATKADIVRLEAAIAAALAAASVASAGTAGAAATPSTKSAHRRKAVAVSVPAVAAGATTERRPARSRRS